MRYGRAIIKMLLRSSSLTTVTRKIGGNIDKHIALRNHELHRAAHGLCQKYMRNREQVSEITV